MNPADVDDILVTVSNRYRRFVLYYFHHYPTDSASVEELARFLSEQQNWHQSRIEVKRKLEAQTLPALDSKGVVSYDDGEGRVKWDALPRWVLSLSERLEEEETDATPFVQCTDCSEFVPAVHRDGSVGSFVSECPNCGGSSFEEE